MGFLEGLRCVFKNEVSPQLQVTSVTPECEYGTSLPQEGQMNEYAVVSFIICGF
jgi:hypothetical protein